MTGIFFLPKEETKKISSRQIARASLHGHIRGWFTVFGIMIIAVIAESILVEDPPSDSGQGLGIFQASALFPMLISYPMSLMVAKYCKDKGFFAFGASFIVGLGIGIATSFICINVAFLLEVVSALLTNDLGELYSLSPDDIFDAITVGIILGTTYGLPAATWFWITICRMCPEAFSGDWIVKKPTRRFIVLIPFGLVLLVWTFFYLGLLLSDQKFL